MSTSTSVVVEAFEPYLWVTCVVVGFITFITNTYILYHEMDRRRNNECQFTTKYLKISSLVCIISGSLFGFFQFTLWFPIFCYFGVQIIGIFITTQTIFMGFFQLSRLYYCFAKNQCYSDKGYSNYLFIIMYTFGFIFLIWSCVYSWFTGFKSECRIDKHGILYYKYTSTVIDNNETYRPLIGGSSLVLLCWDLFTLFLYIYKVISFRKYKQKNAKVHERIMNILYRILLITVMYETMNFIGSLMLFFADILVWFIFGGLSSIVYSYSMVLMQEHNSKKYDTIIEKIYCLKLHYLFMCCGCCCIVSYVNRKVMNDSQEQQLEDIQLQNVQQKKKENDDTFQTGNISTDDQKIDVNPFENSVVTKTN
eukprot:245562_1